MGKKVISFSLYGKLPAYIMGAIANARHANRAYPGWICRFYIADDVPENVIARLKNYGAEVINMGQYSGGEAMLWRFFAMVDPEVDIALSRDTDSRFTKCELLMVNEWLASDKKFHVIRWDLYPPSIMGGLWGVRGGIPNFKKQLENRLRVVENTRKGIDEKFLNDNLYSQMKGDVFLHELDSQVKQRYFMGETIHPFPPIAEDKRGKYLTPGRFPVGLQTPSQRNFVVLSIYKRNPFSEYLLAQLLNYKKRKIFHTIHPFTIRFYVADDIRPDLVERLRRLGKVILKPAKTVRKDDPQYWKLSILSEKNLGLVIITDLPGLFSLTHLSYGKVEFSESPLIEHGHQAGRSQSRQVETVALNACWTDVPVTNIDDLIAQRNPAENYQRFMRSVLYPKIFTMRIPIKLKIEQGFAGTLKGWSGMLLPVKARFTLIRTISHLKRPTFLFKRST